MRADDAPGTMTAPVWPDYAVALAPLLAQAAGEGAVPVSIALDLAGDAPAAPPLQLKAWTERATRTLVFLTAEARGADGRIAASVTAVFRRPAQDAAPR